MVTLKASPNGAQPADVKCCIASLDENGIEFDRFTAENPPDTALINTYDFIVFPSFNSTGWASWTRGATAALITIPMIMLSDGAWHTEHPTLDGVLGGSTLSDKWLDTPWVSDVDDAGKYMAGFGYTHEIDGASPGIPIVSVAALDALTGAAQPLAGRVYIWKNPTDGGSTFYASGYYASNHALLPFLLQEAINDGVITSKVPKRGPLVFDLDHINGNGTTSGVFVEPTILDKIASYVPEGGTIWAGIQNAPTVLDAMSTTVQGKLQQYSGKPFKYCWHDHTFITTYGILLCDGVWPNFTNVDDGGYSTSITKAQQAAQYDADKIKWNNYGLIFHNDVQDGYYNSGSNSWDNATIELFSKNTSKMQSPLNDTVQTGYGFTVFRALLGSPRSPVTNTNLYHNQYKQSLVVDGITIIRTEDLGSNQKGVLNTIDKWRDNFRFITNAISMGSTMYMHDNDFAAAEQDPGVDKHGYVVMQMIADIGSYLKDVVEVFADPTDFVK